MKLTSSRLSVDWAEPGSFYDRSRFDWTGFVTQVTLDGATTFCVPESTDGTGTGGAGLSNEFGIMEPVGFDDCPVGDWFPKIGVGALRRPDDQPYSFARPYEIRKAPIRWEREGEGALSVACDPVPVRGYAVRLVKRISVEENRLVLFYSLENVGENPVATREYAHNFFMVDHGEAKDYALRAPFAVTAWTWPGHIVAEKDTALWVRALPRGSAMYVAMEPLAPGARSFSLVHLPTGAKVTETDSADWSKFTVWGTDRVISGETFLDVDVAPGAVRSWTRTYTFERG
ncbi:MAG: hypothetical protein ACOX5G_10525 [Kiritimatiellia bacterium]|jgi:hypothetical protein